MLGVETGFKKPWVRLSLDKAAAIVSCRQSLSYDHSKLWWCLTRGTYDWSLELWTLQLPCSHVLTVWVLSTKLMITKSQQAVVTWSGFLTFSAGFPQAKLLEKSAGGHKLLLLLLLFHLPVFYSTCPQHSLAIHGNCLATAITCQSGIPASFWMTYTVLELQWQLGQPSLNVMITWCCALQRHHLVTDFPVPVMVITQRLPEFKRYPVLINNTIWDIFTKNL